MIRIRYVISVLHRSGPVDAIILGDHVRSIVSMGIREEACSFTHGRTL